MSGHSHWATIKRKKEAEDKKKGAAFSKVAQIITLAAREGGGNPEKNFKLRIAIDQAKEVNMPSKNVERAIKRGTGELKDQAVPEPVLYEGYGPKGVPVIVYTVTDNTNRTVAALRKVFSQHGGSLGESGSVAWRFDKYGWIIVKPAKIKKSDKFGQPDIEEKISVDKASMELLEAGDIIDIEEEEFDQEKVLGVLVNYKDLAKLTEKIINLGYIVLESGQEFRTNNPVSLSDEEKEKVETNLIPKLQDLDDVQAVWVGL